jgi:hypothetical protein
MSCISEQAADPASTSKEYSRVNLMVGSSFCKALQIFAVALFLNVTVALHAQTSNTGAIFGTVTDSTGAVIPGATVVVTNQATGVARTLSTDASGFYSAESLVSGLYTVTVSQPGFQGNSTQGIQLDAGQRRANNATLAVGQATAEVTVKAMAAAVNTETAESGGTITGEQVSNLMLNGRDFQTLAIMVPGVSSVNGADSISGTGTTLIVNGNSVEYTTYTIDGVYNMNSGSLAQINIVPIVDGISEFRVLKDNYSAKYGFAGSGQVVVNTMSGTNTYHGTAWDFLRNNAFDASNYFSPTTQALHQNIFGYTLGGPVMIPKIYNMDRSKKTFFFASNQWYKITQGSVNRGSVFNDLMRAGDFSLLPGGGAATLSLDTHSAQLLASQGKTNCVTSSTMLNPACFDPAAIAIMNAYMPAANNLSGGFLNYVNSDPVTTNEIDYQYRVDHSINTKNLLTARVMYADQKYVYPYDAWGGNPTNLIRDNNNYSASNALVRLTSTFTPNLVNVLSVAQTEDRTQFHTTLGGTLPSGVAITQAFPGADPMNRIPNVSISGGYSGLGVGAEPITASDGEGIASEDMSWVKRNHVLQFGALYMFGIKRQTVFTLPQGSFTFTGVHTGNPAADYLLGLNTNYTQASTQRHANLHYRQGEAYFQDDWKATHRLTLNLGLRWVYFSNDTASGDQVTTFSPASYDSAMAPVVNVNGSLLLNSDNQPITSSGTPANLLNGLLFAGQNGVPSGFFTPTKKNFGPRLGFAYDVFGDGKTAIRGGYGIGYSRVPIAQIYDAYGQNPPYNLSANILNSLLSTATAGTTAAPTTQSLTNVPLKFTPSQIQSYSLTVEHQLATDMIATVAYAGSLGRHLMTYQGGWDQNSSLPVSSPSASGCLAPGQAPSSSYDFDPCINTGASSPDYTRPYRGYSQMNGEYDEGTSNYNSLQAGLTYRAGKSQFNAAYTYSKVLTTTGVHTAGTPYSQNTVAQNSRNFAAEYGPPAYDFTHDFTGTWVYDIPFFRTSDRLARVALGNWSFAGLALLQTGFAMSPGMATSTAGLAIRPNQVAPYKRIGKLGEWFNTGSFAPPDYGFYGDSSNGSIRGPGYVSFNTALYKTFPITERFSTQFRAEAFNVANHPNFESVSTNVGSGSYGQVTSARDPRILEFAIKLIY